MVNKICVFCISLFFCNSIFSQQITFKAWNDSLYAALDTFSANAVADDFDPRRYCSPTNRNWYEGVDYKEMILKLRKRSTF